MSVSDDELNELVRQLHDATHALSQTRLENTYLCEQMELADDLLTDMSKQSLTMEGRSRGASAALRQALVEPRSRDPRTSEERKSDGGTLLVWALRRTRRQVVFQDA